MNKLFTNIFSFLLALFIVSLLLFFAKNEIFMCLLAESFPAIEVLAAEIAQASALGAASVIHNAWNSKRNVYPQINLKKY